jgi:hypothetical protein
VRHYPPVVAALSRLRGHVHALRSAATSKGTAIHILRAIVIFVAICASAPALAQTISRTSDDHPDLQGVWTQRWITPLERLPDVPDLKIEAADEAAFKARMMALYKAGDPLQAQDDYDPLEVLKVRGELRSSLIVDPADGRLPYTDEGKARRAAWLPNRQRGADHPEQRGDNERCIGISSAYVPYLTAPVANIRQIVQTKDHVVIYTEHYIITRIIPFGDQPATLNDRHGRAKARWDGDTLVVETTGFRPDDTTRFVPMSVLMISPGTKITEQFVPLGPDEILYRFTVEDPLLYTRPWSAETIMSRSSDRMLEYACHEGNHGLANILSGGRAMDRRRN